MKNKEKIGFAALAFGAAFVVSGCGVLEKAADSTFEYKATLDTGASLVDCYTNSNPSAKIEKGKTTVVFDRAFCFDQTPNARKLIGMPLKEPFSGEITVDNIGVIEKPLTATFEP